MPPPPSMTDPDPAAPQALARDAFGGHARPLEYGALAGGTYNTVYEVVLHDGRHAVPKLAPPPDQPRLSYEHALLSTEAMASERARPLVGALVPEVLHLGTVPGDPRREYLFLGRLPGTPLHGARSGLAPERLDGVRRELGRTVAALHTVTGHEFGCLGSPALRAPTWPEAFQRMVEAVVAGARRFSVHLPGGGARILEVVSANLAHLTAVRTPVLTHFDLWDGNVLVAEGGGARLSGLIDAERAFWGDPAAELVSLTLFDDIHEETALLAGYREGGGDVDLTPGLLRRLTLYRIYLHLIMFTELTPHGNAPDEAARARVFLTEHLESDLARLDSPIG